MPKLTVQNLANKEVFVRQGQTVLKALQEEGQDWMHACGGKGRCTTCRIIVLQGMEHFAPLTACELKYREKGRIEDNERQTCQCTMVSGEAVVKVPEQTKLPHLNYS
ncbi:2Fe-2S iron-sulfur cluster-binding protein [Pontibacter harenae]|uniref:2Fe-2S iron-sulfur cluster-binding protein n=1 Tax=Pontibacter harenae TaxID=2894083 RepID=UPI001E2D0846|nr:2Fe-2S iron-sulfur cluster-binding protein [Pontibacter harenae]MCC9167787.1 (2Fe-2S)-binding protein [Pontibacter harenae]